MDDLDNGTRPPGPDRAKRRLALGAALVALAMLFGTATATATAPHAAAEPAPASSGDSPDRSSLRRDIAELRKLLRDKNIKAGVRINELLERISAKMPGCVGRCIAERIAESTSPPSVRDLLRYGAECAYKCYTKSKVKSRDELADEHRKAQAEKKRARKALRDASPAGKKEAEKRFSAAEEKERKAYREWQRAVDRDKVERAVSRHIADQDRRREGEKKGKKDGGESGGEPTGQRPVTPPRGPRSGGPGATKTPSTDATATPGRKVTAPKAALPGRRGRGGAAEVVGDLLGQAYQDHVSAEHEKVYREALSDPELRKEIIRDHQELKGSSPVDQLIRGFDTSKGFTQGTTRAVGPRLAKVQKTLDDVNAMAERSNSDPLYRQARRECGGYETCVQERVRKLRAKSVSPRQAAIRKQENLDRQQADLMGHKPTTKPTTKKKPITPRQAAIKKQENLDRQQADLMGHKPTAKKNTGKTDTTKTTKTGPKKQTSGADEVKRKAALKKQETLKA